MTRTVLVTGAAGFIGSHACEALKAQGDLVIGFDNFNDYYDVAQKRANAKALEIAGIEIVEGDIRNADHLEQVFREYQPSIVVHLAAMAGVRASVDEPHYYFDVNLSGTLNLLEQAKAFDVKNFIFASTSSAYGLTKSRPFLESEAADQPLAPYPASKRCAELLGHAYWHSFKIPFTSLRFFTVFGPRNRPDMLPSIVMRSIDHGEPLSLYNHGDMHRDWTYVDDIVKGVVSASNRPLGYEIINLGRGSPVHIREFVHELGKLAGKQPEILETPMPPADVPITFASIEKAKTLLDYHPSTELKQGIRSFYEWYRKQPTH